MKKIIFGLFLLCIFALNANATCSIAINYPDNNFYTEDITPDFNYTCTGTKANYICNISIDSVYDSELETPNATTKVLTPSALTIREHNWIIACANATESCVTSSRVIDIGDMKYEGMNDMRKFIADLSAIIIKLIPLIIVLMILAVVWKFKDFFNGILSRFK